MIAVEEGRMFALELRANKAADSSEQTTSEQTGVDKQTKGKERKEKRGQKSILVHGRSRLFVHVCTPLTMSWRCEGAAEGAERAAWRGVNWRQLEGPIQVNCHRGLRRAERRRKRLSPVFVGPQRQGLLGALEAARKQKQQQRSARGASCFRV